MNLIRSFDYNENVMADVVRPEKYGELFAALNKSGEKSPLIARGSGLTYGAASMGEGVTSVLMSSFRRILSFNEKDGEIEVEGGAQLGEILSFLLSRGWYLPVIPGHPGITVGGSVAFNVHGKNQFHVGFLDHWIKSLLLYHPKYGEVRCSQDKYHDLFDLTVGGMGFTGVILSVTFKIIPLPAKQIKLQKFSVSTLLEASELILKKVSEFDFIYSSHFWGRNRQQTAPGFVYASKWEKASQQESKQVFFGYKHFDPAFEFSRLRQISPGPLRYSTSRVFSKINYWRESQQSETKVIDIWDALYPVQKTKSYFFLFPQGRFREFQAIVPMARWQEFSEKVTHWMFNQKFRSVMTSLKLIRGERKHLRYSETGIGFSINFPRQPNEEQLLTQLDDLSVEFNLVPYLCKDSRMTSMAARKIFPDYEVFKKTLNAYDPQKCFSSKLRHRLEI